MRAVCLHPKGSEPPNFGLEVYFFPRCTTYLSRSGCGKDLELQRLAAHAPAGAEVFHQARHFVKRKRGMVALSLTAVFLNGFDFRQLEVFGISRVNRVGSDRVIAG